MSGTLSPKGNPDDLETGEFERLPTTLIPDWRRLYDFGGAKRDDLKVDTGDFNVAKRIDTAITDALGELPRNAITHDGTRSPEGYERNLAFRTLTRAQKVALATGQQVADRMHLPRLTAEQMLNGDGGGAVLDHLEGEHKDELIASTPLWFYILREAELNKVNNGRLTGVGGRIVAEVFHRAMEGSQISILREHSWRPTFGTSMADLLLFAFEGKAELLNPLGE